MRLPRTCKKENKKLTDREQAFERGVEMILAHPIFSELPNNIVQVKGKPEKTGIAVVDSHGAISVNLMADLTPAEWAYTIAHCSLHNAFGHFDLDVVPGYVHELSESKTEKIADFDKAVWNMACDIFITRFLADIKFGQPIVQTDTTIVPNGVQTEQEIYQYLIENRISAERQIYGTAAEHRPDMDGLDKPIVYDKQNRYNCSNRFQDAFSRALVDSVKKTIAKASGVDEMFVYESNASHAAKWFMNHYPLLGGVASSFRVVEDNQYCIRNQIQVAAIDVDAGEIYINNAVRLSEDEWKFVLAHEYLHAGLSHHVRCGERDFQLWNVACDFVINDWLVDLQIGRLPSLGVLYDPDLHNLSAETIYDMLVENLRKSKKLDTFRGYGLGDMLNQPLEKRNAYSNTISMEDVCREALQQGLEYHQSGGRGLIPAGLVEEIRALAMPPVPWDVKLANWFQEFFPLPEKQRSYARPSRRQGATPDIPRPSYITREERTNQKTFGVIVDTSGSMSAEQIGFALGAIASYAAAREVPYARVVFCDAQAYDAGYISPEEIAGCVEVKGRGGTRLQPAVDLLESAKDFPKDGPILIITDGGIENKLTVHRQHAYLLPKGYRLPFRTQAPIFYYE